MKKLCLVALFCLLHAFCMAQNLNNVNALLQNYDGSSTAGASLMVIIDGKVFLKKGYGMADLEKAYTVKPNTAFRLASVTKQFTATAILMLVNEGRLTLNTKLTEMLPGFPAYGNKITLRHMLNHTSGLPDYEDFVPDSAMYPQIKDAGVLALMMKTDKGLFEPGAKYQYSNTAYALLAMIVENYTRTPFGTFLEQRIFKPLNMLNTVAFEQGKNKVRNRAFGYVLKDGIWTKKDQSATSAVLGDGGIYSTTEDLFKWDQCLYTSKLLPEALLNETFAYNKLNDGSTVDYGFGWHLKKTNEGLPVVYHTGSTTGFRNIIYRIPSRNTTLILLTNRNRPEETNMVKLAEKILKAVF